MTVVRDPEATSEARKVWWRERRFVIIGVVVLLVAIFFIWRGCHKAPAAADTGDVVVSVQVAKAERGPIANEIASVATLTARNQADIMPKISAQIKEMPLLVNRVVNAGDVLVVLEARDISAQRAEAGAAVQEAETAVHTTANGAVPLTNAQDRKSVHDAQATLDNATKTYERRKVLFAQGGISKKDLEASQLAVTVAEGDLRLAESSSSLHHGVTNPGDVRIAEAKANQAHGRLANLEAQLGYTTIRAPFRGVITEQFQHQGDFASPSTKMLTIADASTLIAKMEVSEATATQLQAGDRVKVVPDDLPGVAFGGTISLVGRGADVQSRSVEVWVIVPNPDGRLRPNGVARVTIAAQQKNDAIVIPSSAVTLDATNGNAGTVMVVDGQSVAHEVHVTTGIRSGGRTEVLSGLKGGETVVTEGNYGLPDGTKVALPGAVAKKQAQARRAPPAPLVGQASTSWAARRPLSLHAAHDEGAAQRPWSRPVELVA
jgi:multidrug efflux pump subunit AcrA (membrane-fusion protein)